MTVMYCKWLAFKLNDVDSAAGAHEKLKYAKIWGAQKKNPTENINEYTSELVRSY